MLKSKVDITDATVYKILIDFIKNKSDQLEKVYSLENFIF